MSVMLAQLSPWQIVEIALAVVGGLVVALLLGVMAAALALLIAGKLPGPYHWRNLFVRKSSTILTVLVIAAVVGTFTWLLGFADALRGSLAVASDRQKIIVMQKGAISEFNSALPPDDFNKLAQLDGVQTDTASGKALISAEMMVQVQLPRVADRGATRANVAVRGVTETAFNVHRSIRLDGPTFSTGAPEVIVGNKAARQFQGLNVGDEVRLGFAGNRTYRVVGHFSADGGPLESEIWGYLPSLQSAYGRTAYSSANILLQPETDARAAVQRIAAPPIELEAQTEADYWREQAKNVTIYQIICYALIAMMAVAAVFSIANTMFAAVAGRAREIAMLRTIGFSRVRVLMGFVVEAVFLSLMGGALGCLGCAAYLALAGNTKDMFGANTFTSLAFEIRLSALIVFAALVSVCVVGVLGALVPAWRAARTEVIAALREP